MMETQDECGGSKRERLLEELKREIQKGIDSGPATPLDMEEIKQKGRQRLSAIPGSAGWWRRVFCFTPFWRVLATGVDIGVSRSGSWSSSWPGSASLAFLVGRP